MPAKTVPTQRADLTELTGLGSIDPLVRIQAQAADRRRQKQEREARKRVRPRASYDLPAKVIEGVREIARKERVPCSDLAMLALIRFLQDYEDHQVNLDSMLEPATNSLHFDWRVRVPAEWE
jgi:hypothetical protein